jgi:hypothetical protein
MNVGLIVLLIIAIPATAIIDYFAFRKGIEYRTGRPVRWFDFIVPCAVEIFCFIAGYILGGAGI